MAAVLPGESMAHTASESKKRHRVVVVGGGFAGVDVCLGLRRADCDVTLVDRRNFHLFQPLLYQVATGGLSPGDITAPLRSVVKKLPHVRTLMGEVVDFDVADRAVLCRDGARIPWDSLIVATGVTHSYFGNDAWQEHAPGLKNIEDATAMRARILHAFEAAEGTNDARERQAWLTFVVVGGGPTGVELAGALGELAAHTMKGEFRAIDSADAKILLVEATPGILPMYVPRLGVYAIEALQELGVAVVLQSKVTGVDARGVDLQKVDGTVERIEARTVLWAAGVQASPLGALLAQRTGAATDRAGRLMVAPDLTLPGHPDIFVLGDLAHFAHTDDKKALPGVAPVAMQMGRHTARTIARRIRGAARETRPEAFAYFDKGNMAVIGRNRAVARVGIVDWNMRGFPAWLAWLFVHIAFLVGFENKLLVLLQWASYYLTRHRGARLIAPPLAPPRNAGG